MMKWVRRRGSGGIHPRDASRGNKAGRGNPAGSFLRPRLRRNTLFSRFRKIPGSGGARLQTKRPGHGPRSQSQRANGRWLDTLLWITKRRQNAEQVVQVFRFKLLEFAEW